MDYFKSLCINKKIIIVMFFALCLPYYLNIPIYTGILIYVVISKQFIPLCSGINKLFYIFLFIITMTSCYYQNYLGLGGCFAFFLLFTHAFFYQKNIDKKLFEVCLDILIIVSVIWGFVSLFQYLNILEENDITTFVIKIFSQRQNRVSGSVYNANYYGSALELIMLVTIYKMITIKNKKLHVFYGVSFAWNSFFLFLSGCRTSWIALPIAVFVFFLCNKKHKITLACCISGIIVFIYFMFNLEKIPRIEYLAGNLGVRQLIWSTAITAIGDTPFFGQGPFTYMLVYEALEGHATQHAHNLFLEPLLSFGIIGCIPLCGYFFGLIRQAYSYYRSHRSIIALIFACIITTLVHGLTDYSIFFVHPGFIFLFIISSYVIVEGE